MLPPLMALKERTDWRMRKIPEPNHCLRAYFPAPEGGLEPLCQDKAISIACNFGNALGTNRQKIANGYGRVLRTRYLGSQGAVLELSRRR